MKIICAWCGKHIGNKEGEGTSHSICEDCYEREIEKIEEEKKEDYYEKGRRSYY